MTLSRWVTGWVLLAAFPVSGCSGRWVDVDTRKPAEDGETAGGSTGPSEPGAPTQAAAGYDFQLIPGLHEAGEDPRDFDSRARLVSENGELVVGTTSLFSPLPLGLEDSGDGVYDGESRYFVWSPAAGTRPWEGPQTSSMCLSGDGTAIFSWASPDPNHGTRGFIRWSGEEGVQLIGELDAFPGGELTSCSYDGKRAAGYYGHSIVAPVYQDMHPVFWEEGRWGDGVHAVEESEAPGGVWGWVAAVGTVSTISSGVAPDRLYWAEGEQAHRLLAQPATKCALAPASRDGRVGVSQCGLGGYEIYRWTADTDEFTRLGEVSWDESSVEQSDDGSAVVAYSGRELRYFRNGQAVSHSFDSPVSVFGFSDDGSTVYLQQAGLAGRWSEAEGFVPLESLSELPCTALTYPRRNGPRLEDAALPGLVSIPSALTPGTCDWSLSRAVVWDSQGLRDIAAELSAAGVNLQGVDLRRADHVWAGSGLRIMGTGQLANGARRTFIAQLPARD